MKARAGLLGGTLGLVAASAAGIVAVDRAAAGRRRAAVKLASGEFGRLPFDRCGSVAAGDGVGLYYEEVGPEDAPLTVVFSHGFCLTMDSFWFQRRDLQQRYGERVRMVFYDQRSHGRSDKAPGRSISVDQLGRDLGAVIDTVAPRGPVVLVGHSMGGMTVLALADQRRRMFVGGAARIAAAGLISTSAGDLKSITLGLPSLVARVGVPLLPLVMRGAATQPALTDRVRSIGGDLSWAITKRLSFVGDDVDPATVEFLAAMIAATPVDVVSDYYRALLAHDKTGAVATFAGLPTAVICGDEDLLTPLEHSERIAALLPEAQLTVVARAGHMALLERPDRVTSALDELIASVAPRRRTRVS